MMSIAPVKSGGNGGAQYYFDEYFEDAPGSKGKWYGNGSKNLKLTGAVERHHLQGGLSGFEPGGNRKLVQNAGAKNRQEGWDICFSVEKSISSFYAVSGVYVRQEIVMCIERAIERALGELEKRGGRSRNGTQEEVPLIFAAFLHKYSRAHDPHLHVHCVLINAFVRANGESGALWSHDIYRLKMFIGDVFRTHLATELKIKLGLEVRYQDGYHRVVGVPREVNKEFSQRRAQIEDALNIVDLHSSKASAIAALETRPPKLHVRMDDLFASWRSRAEKFGWGEDQATALIKHPHFRRSMHDYNAQQQSLQVVQQQSTPASVIETESKKGLPWWTERGSESPKPAIKKQEDKKEQRASQIFEKAKKRQTEVSLYPKATAKTRGQLKRMGNPWRLTGTYKRTFFADFVIEKRLMFANAPFWSPFKNLQIRRLRVHRKSTSFMSKQAKIAILKWVARRRRVSKLSQRLSERHTVFGQSLPNVRVENIHQVGSRALRRQNYRTAAARRERAMSKLQRHDRNKERKLRKMQGKYSDQTLIQSFW